MRENPYFAILRICIEEILRECPTVTGAYQMSETIRFFVEGRMQDLLRREYKIPEIPTQPENKEQL